MIGTNPRTPEDKVAVFSKCIARNENSFSPLECVQKRTVTFEEEESSTSAMSYIPAIPVESPTSIDPSNSKSAVHNQPQYEEDHTKYMGRKNRPEVQDKYETDDNDEEKTTSEDNIEWNKGEELKIMRIKMMVETMMLIKKPVPKLHFVNHSKKYQKQQS
ncbi:hypothetical protein RhiirC2_718733 [Rhizophagus irregularis]|uniref:Uncharacterized protein n=1 Tax=Rhizophagus irregularis TaxID=588596 RepID=A0A2N1MH47_9GLOM|nr:hypothetical protein RhiirC2_718733 [Rhizophagus irregularis]